MNEFKRAEGKQELRQVSSTPRLLRTKEEKDQRQRILNLRPKEVFLTDTQTDQTKSSNEMQGIEVERLQYSVRKLQKQNRELKDTILKLKANQFYGINQEKLKNLIKENQLFKQEVKTIKKELDKILIEKDFLERNNKAYKAKYEQLTKESNKPMIQSRLKTQFNHFHDYQLLEDIDVFFKENRPTVKQKRSISSEKSKTLRKKTNSSRLEEKVYPQGKKLKENNSNRVNEHYFVFPQGKSSKKNLHS